MTKPRKKRSRAKKNRDEQEYNWRKVRKKELQGEKFVPPSVLEQSIFFDPMTHWYRKGKISEF